MLHIINSKILISGALILAAAALIIGATFAFFSDTETSTANTFAAGSLDLKVDSESHYAGLVCRDLTTDDDIDNPLWVDDPAVLLPTTRPDLLGDACDGTWEENDLGSTNKFFNLTDVKPGDSGEDTISLHVIDNDAWGNFVIHNVQDLENGCTTNEEDAGDITCDPINGNGELRENISFNIWLDEGLTNGFQCSTSGSGTPGVARCEVDPTEGDNIQQETEPTLVTPGTLDAGGETHSISQGIQAAYALNGCSGDGSSASPCPGLTADGHMIGSITYYFGLGWELPDTVGNEIQTDSLVADMTFQVVQYRSNPAPVFPTPGT